MNAFLKFGKWLHDCLIPHEGIRERVYDELGSLLFEEVTSDSFRVAGDVLSKNGVSMIVESSEIRFGIMITHVIICYDQSFLDPLMNTQGECQACGINRWDIVYGTPAIECSNCGHIELS